MSTKISLMAFAMTVLILVAGCSASEPTAAPLVPTDTLIPPTITPLAATATIPPPSTPAIAEGLITFTSSRDESYDIYIMNADGSDLRQLTNDPGTEGYASISPDGAKIAFYAYDDLITWSIYVMNVDGSDRERLTDREGVWDSAPAWSPDGLSIAFGREHEDKSEIWVMSADGSNQKLLESRSGGEPRWSPDGTQIIFSSYRDGNAEIYVMNADGSDQRRITTNAADDWWPDWSPDGTQIAFMSDRDGNWEIYVMPAPGFQTESGTSDQQRLTSNDAEDRKPDWSPDGRKIVFLSDRDGDYELYIMNADGTDVQQITHNTASDIQPAWWPLPAEIALPIVESETVLMSDGTGTVTDLDGNEYPIIQIGAQWWMAESLRVTRDPGGNPILTYCYASDERNCELYGRFYSWDIAMNDSSTESAQGICPTDWHIPSDSDWDELIEYLGGEDVAGGKMKASGIELWSTPNLGATNESGFNGLPAGSYNLSGKYFEGLGIGVHFWSSTEKGSNAGLPTLHHQYESVLLLTEPKTIVASVRCVMD